jgi:hypothetical protein
MPWDQILFMSKTLAGVLAASIAVLLFAGCGGANNSTSDMSTTTTTPRTVVDTYCGDMAAAIRAGLISETEYSALPLDQIITGDTFGVITMVWSDGSITPTKERCILIDGPSLEEQGNRLRTYEDGLRENN